MNSFSPPPYYVKYARTAAWLRLGKIAVFSVLAALAVAVGLALPDGKDAAAQGVSVRAGYSYSRMICQEWGQQPRWYNVRDPIAGSDWRNDGGWAIILVRGTTTIDARIVTMNDNFAIPSFRFRTNLGGIDYGRLITDNSGGTWDGWSGRVQLNVGNQESNVVVIDQNGDGVITVADRTAGTGGNAYRSLLWSETGGSIVVGSSYIRWADMRWCR